MIYQIYFWNKLKGWLFTSAKFDNHEIKDCAPTYFWGFSLASIRTIPFRRRDDDESQENSSRTDICSDDESISV